MKSDHDGDHLRIGKLSCPIAAFLITCKLKLFGLGNLLRKFFVEITCTTENFCNFIPETHKQKRRKNF